MWEVPKYFELTKLFSGILPFSHLHRAFLSTSCRIISWLKMSFRKLCINWAVIIDMYYYLISRHSNYTYSVLLKDHTLYEKQCWTWLGCFISTKTTDLELHFSKANFLYRSCPLFLQIIVFLIISLIKINGPCVALKDNTCFVVLLVENFWLFKEIFLIMSLYIAVRYN